MTATATKPTSRRVPRGSGIAATPKSQADEDAALLAQAEEQVEEQRTLAQQAKPEATRQTRANPRDAAEFNDEEGNPLRRKVSRGGNPYDIPEKLKKPGWDYQWQVIRVMGEPVDPSDLVDIRNGGWRPVPAADMKAIIPPGWDKPHVERGGQILYMRPMHLTKEAQAEDIKIAEEQRFDKLKGALAGPQELQKIAPRHVEKLEIFGSVGNTSKDG